ncbi:MAG TPA: flagellin [Terracidiphilus sp.]|jgi:flagellin
MGLGVLNNLSAIYAENNLNNTNNSLQTVLQQLSSGSKINSGADDAAGLSLVNGLEANQTALSQSETNATEGVGLLDVADGALSQVTNLLNRAITLATESSNGTLNSTQEAAANQEYQSILSEINNIGSTTTYNQEQVFAGNTIAIYTGDSSTAGSSIDDLYIRPLSSSNVGDSAGAIAYSSGANNVFLDLSSDGTNAAVSDSLSGTATTIDVSYLTKGSGGSAVTATAAITVGAGTTYANTAQGLINAINNAGLGLNATFTTAGQAGTAAVSTALAANATTAGTGNDTGIEISGTGLGTGTNGTGVVGALSVGADTDVLAGTMTIVGSDGKSHTITLGEADSTDTLANLAATINTDSYGVTASLTNGGTTMTLTTDDSAVTVSGSEITDTTAPAPAILPNLASLAGTLSVTASGDLLGGTLTVTDTTGGTHTVTLGTPGSTDTLADLANYLNVTNAGWGITATVTGGTAMTFAGTGLDNVTGTGLTDTAVPVTTDTALTSVPTADTPYYAQVGTFTVAAGTDALSGTLQIGQNTITLGAAGSTATIGELATYINDGSFGVKATLNPAGTGIAFTSANSSMTFGGAPMDGATADPVVTTANASYSEYYSVGISGSVTDSSTGGGTAATGLTVDTNGTGGTATISYSDGAGVDLASTDLTSQSDSETALIDINDAISAAAALDGYVGGQINTLDAISQVMSTQQENVVSAQNAVQATDYASATSNMSKYEILSQTGIAALAQANSVQQEVTKLLQ